MRPVWRKSRRSNTQGNECVEIADIVNGVGVRDSKAPEAGHLAVSPEVFAEFVARVKRDELDL